MKTFRFNKRDSLTWRQAVRVMLAALILGGVVFLVEVCQLYGATKQQISATQKQILDLAESPLSSASWDLSERLAERTLNSLLAIDIVIAGEILLPDEGRFSYKTKPSVHSLTKVESAFHPLFKELNLVKRELKGPDVAAKIYGEQTIAHLIVSFDTNLITARFVQKVYQLFWTTIIRSLLLAIILGVIFHRFLTRPIMLIGEQLRQVNPDAPKVHELAYPDEHNRGEMSFLVSQFNSMLRKLVSNQRNLRQLATRDPLTGLPNRALIYEELGRSIRRSKENGKKFAVLFLDLDRFKHINDSMGHAVGDKLLCHISESLKKQLPISMRVGRLGGDEFIVVCETLKNDQSAFDKAKDVLAIINQKFTLEHVKISPSCSIGIAIFPDNGTDIDALVRHADIAMYYAKKQGANRYEQFNRRMMEDSEARFIIETQLEQALEEQQFELFYQPKICLSSGKIIGCEALIRWKKDKQYISPDKFIPVAEDCHLIIPIGNWVLQKACETLCRWQKKNIDIFLSINVSPIQLTEPEFFSHFSELVKQYEHCYKSLQLEITESSLMTNLTQMMGLLNQLQKLGIKISIDDFGTGYSSLAYLRQLALDNLKIDKSFINDIPGDTVIPSSILALASQLGLKTIAEGVESEEQLNWLADNGCDLVQGYYFSKPLPLDEFEEKFLSDSSQKL